MEAKVIIVSVVKSNKSENNVWAVGITGEEQEQAYCKRRQSSLQSSRHSLRLRRSLRREAVSLAPRKSRQSLRQKQLPSLQ